MAILDNLMPIFCKLTIFSETKKASISSFSRLITSTGSPVESVVHNFLPILSLFSEIRLEAASKMFPVDL